jgi:glutamate carboxypeptidase
MQTRDLSDPARGVKFNWTLGKAGTTRNVIPDLATAEADVRVQRVADYDGVEKTFRERTTKKLIEETQVEPAFERRRPPLEPSPAARQVVARAQAIYGELGRKLEHDDAGTGGGTDAAFAALSGKPAVVERFGLSGSGTHSEGEWVDLDSIQPHLYLLTRLVMDISRN